MLTLLGLGRVLGDLAEMGFDASWGVLGASSFGAPHRRERIWILATNANSQPLRLSEEQASEEQASEEQAVVGNDGKTELLADSESERLEKWGHTGIAGLAKGSWWSVEPRMGRVAYGMAHWVDRLKAIGNGQVPVVAATAWEMLLKKASNSSM